MVHCLSAVAAGVDDDPVALAQVLFVGYLGGSGHQVTEECGVFRKRLRGGDDVPPGNDQKMDWGLWIDVGEADADVVLIDPVGWNRTFDDLAEETVGRSWYVGFDHLHG